MRRFTNRPVIAVGSALLDTDFKAPDGKVRAALVPATLKRMAEGIATGEFDMVAVGRALLANPDLARRIFADETGALRGYDRTCLDRLI